LLPLLDAFRTFDWRKVREEINNLVFVNLKEMAII